MQCSHRHAHAHTHTHACTHTNTQTITGQALNTYGEGSRGERKYLLGIFCREWVSNVVSSLSCFFIVALHVYVVVCVQPMYVLTHSSLGDRDNISVYMCNSSYHHHHQIGSITLSRCCHFSVVECLRWLHHLILSVIIYIYMFICICVYSSSTKIRVLFPLLLCSLCVQTLEHIKALRYYLFIYTLYYLIKIIITFYFHYNTWGWMCSTGPFKYRWLKGYIYISCYYMCLIVISKSEAWIISHSLGPGHETIECTVCLVMSFYIKCITAALFLNSITLHDIQAYQDNK